MATGHGEVRKALAAHAIGATEDPERSRIERHLEACAVCRDELAQLQDAAAQALAPDGAAPDAVWTRVVQAIRGQDQTQSGGDVGVETG